MRNSKILLPTRRKLITGAASSALFAALPATAQPMLPMIAVGHPTPYLGQVATKCWIPYQVSTANKQYMSRSPHKSRAAISSLKIVIPNWRWDANSSKDEVGSGGNATFTASVEYPAGTFTRIQFGGSNSVTVADGDNAVSDFCTVSIPNDTWFWIRIWCSAAVGIVYAQLNKTGTIKHSVYDAGNGHALTFAASGVVDQTMSGTVANTAVTPPLPCVMPVAILANITQPSVFLMGDSITFGYGDTFDSSGDLGLTARSVGTSWGYINAGCFDEWVNDTAVAGAYAKRGDLIQYCSHVICELGHNDIFTNGTAAATIETKLGIMYALAAGKKRYQTTITPRTTSTDAWATTGNQTIAAHNSIRDTLNTWIRGTPSPLDGYFDTADVLETARNSGIWATPPTPTADGAHPNQAAYLAVQSSGAINAAAFNYP